MSLVTVLSCELVSACGSSGSGHKSGTATPTKNTISKLAIIFSYLFSVGSLAYMIIQTGTPTEICWFRIHLQLHHIWYSSYPGHQRIPQSLGTTPQLPSCAEAFLRPGWGAHGFLAAGNRLRLRSGCTNGELEW